MRSLKATLFTYNPLKLFLETPFYSTDLSSKVYLFREAFSACQTQKSSSHTQPSIHHFTCGLHCTFHSLKLSFPLISWLVNSLFLYYLGEISLLFYNCVCTQILEYCLAQSGWFTTTSSSSLPPPSHSGCAFRASDSLWKKWVRRGENRGKNSFIKRGYVDFLVWLHWT